MVRAPNRDSPDLMPRLSASIADYHSDVHYHHLHQESKCSRVETCVSL